MQWQPGVGRAGSASVREAPHWERESPAGMVEGRFCQLTGAQEPLQHPGVLPVGSGTAKGEGAKH